MLRFIDGFDHLATGDLTEKYHQAQNASISTGGGRRGTHALALHDGLSWCSLTLDAQPRWTVGFALRFGALPAPARATFLEWLTAGTLQLSLFVSGEGYVGAALGPARTLLGQSAQALHNNVYYYVEASVLSDPAGLVQVRVDGVEWLALSGLNTQPSPGVVPNQVRLGATGPDGLFTCRIDDLYICDGQGSGTFTTFLGDCRVDALFPNADGTYTAWTPSAGTAHSALVDEPQPNDDTDYVSTPTGGARDSYQLQPLPTMPNPTVLAVQACINARKDDVDELLIKPLLVSGGVTAVATTVHELNAGYKYAMDLWTLDPGTSLAWTEAAVNSLQIGMERPA